jgi:DNA repair exonuclease SbcCD ATPase subunit
MEDIKELVKYSVTDEALETYRKEFLPLTIKGLDDHDGYEKVKEARLFIKGERVNVEKKRVELKASALEYGRAVDAEAKRITTAIEEIEGHLMAEQKKIDDENARIKFEKEQREKLPERKERLAGIGADVADDTLLKLTDDTFESLFNTLNAERLEKQRLAQEERDREQKAEQERIEAEKKALEQKRLEAEREEQHKAEIAAAEKKAAEDARIQAEIDAKRKEDERIAQEARDKAEQERIEAERPDNEKLQRFADSLQVLHFPEVTTKKAQAKVERVKKLFVQIVEELKAA